MQIAPIISNVGSATSNRSSRIYYPYPQVWVNIFQIEQRDDVTYSIILKLKDPFITGILFVADDVDMNQYNSWDLAINFVREIKHLIVTNMVHEGSQVYRYSLVEDVVFNWDYREIIFDTEYHLVRTPVPIPDNISMAFDIDAEPCLDTPSITFTLTDILDIPVTPHYVIFWYSPDDKGVEKKIFKQLPAFRGMNIKGGYDYGSSCYCVVVTPEYYTQVCTQIGTENIMSSVALPFMDPTLLEEHIGTGYTYYLLSDYTISKVMVFPSIPIPDSAYTKFRFSMIGEVFEFDLRKYSPELNLSIGLFGGSVKWSIIPTYKGFVFFTYVGLTEAYILDRWEVASQMPIASDATALFWKQNPTAREQATLQQAGMDVQARNAQRTLASETASAALGVIGSVVSNAITPDPAKLVGGIVSGIDKAQQAGVSYANTMDTVNYNRDKIEKEYQMNLKNLSYQNPTMRNMVNLEGNTIYELDQVPVIAKILPTPLMLRIRRYYEQFGYNTGGTFGKIEPSEGYWQASDVLSSITDMRGVHRMRVLLAIGKLLEGGFRFVFSVNMTEVEVDA